MAALTSLEKTKHTALAKQLAPDRCHHKLSVAVLASRA